jgi:lipopolysaccharide transport system ATP-binding protein
VPPPAIRVRNLSKKYQIGAREARPTSFREALTGALASPFRRFQNLRGTSSQAETFWALKDVSFDIEEGEVVGVIGRNGAGKSTLLKILSQITEPTSGEVELHGRVGSLLEVGTGFHPELSGRENIYLNGAILGMKREEITKRFDEIVAFAEVEQFLDTPVKRYSSGMYMRLAFAVAAHLEPEILVVDEVLAVGDAEFQRKCLGKMNEVSKQGRTVLFVSHNMNAIEALCNKALLLRCGEICSFSNEVRQVLMSYLNGGSGDSALTQWRNPGRAFANLWFRPIRFFIGNSDASMITDPVRNDSDFYVYVEGEVGRSDPALQIGYRLVNSDGVTLFWSLTTDSADYEWPKLNLGKCLLRSSIPKRMLNEGDYHLELSISLNYREWICQPGRDAPSIRLSVQGGLSDSPYWTSRRNGLFAPQIPWKVISEPAF